MVGPVQSQVGIHPTMRDRPRRALEGPRVVARKTEFGPSISPALSGAGRGRLSGHRKGAPPVLTSQ